MGNWEGRDVGVDLHGARDDGKAGAGQRINTGGINASGGILW